MVLPPMSPGQRNRRPIHWLADMPHPTPRSLQARIRIGTSGWSIPSRYAAAVPSGNSHLARYGQLLSAVEIDTSFYRHHRKETYRRWAATVPRSFRFAVKTPSALTAQGTLALSGAVLERFLGEVSGLGGRLGVLLVQLAPTVAFEAGAAATLFRQLREHTAVQLACEPRHASWGSVAAEQCLRRGGVARVAADPPRWPGGDSPGGAASCVYFRMHGQPRIYFSEYAPERLERLAAQIAAAAARSAQVWCLLDNTAHGHALGNALTLQRRLAG